MANILYRGLVVPSAYATANTAGAGKNGPLTNTEIDQNFWALDDLKFNKAGGTITGETSIGTAQTAANLTVYGNLTINGTTTTINTATLSVDDQNIILGDVASPTNATAEGGGITLKGATDKTIIWDSTNTNWTSSEHWNIATGKSFKINNTSVLSSSTLGSGVTSSSLTKLGTTAGFVKSDANGNLSSDTNTYLTSVSTANIVDLNVTTAKLAAGAATIAKGGVGFTSYTKGDILYASAADTLSKLAVGSDGQVLKLSGGVPSWGTDNDTVYSLPLAADGTRGGVQIGYVANAKNYPVQLSGEKMYVNVPWTDTDTNTWDANSKTVAGYVSAPGAVANKVWKTDASGNPGWRDDADTDTNTWDANALNVAGYVAAPISTTANKVWKTDGSGNPAWRDDADTVYSLPLAASGTRGGVQIGYATDGTNRNYAVQLSGEKMYVNVPWSDTDTNTTYSAGTGLTLTGTSFSVNYGTTSTTACAGNDSRLSDARAPTAHTHSYLPLSGGTLTGSLLLGGNSVNLLNGTTNNGAGGLRAKITANENSTSPAGYNTGGSTSDGTIYIEAEHGDVGGIAISADGATIYNSGDRGYLLRVIDEDLWQLEGPNYIAGDPGSTVTAVTPNRLVLTATGNLTISGAFTATGNVTAYSDVRLKTNIVKIENALNKVEQLNGYTFDRIDMQNVRQTGVIAQEVLKVLPEAVSGNDQDKYTVAYGNMVGLLIEAIKELNAKVEDLQNQLANK